MGFPFCCASASPASIDCHWTLPWTLPLPMRKVPPARGGDTPAAVSNLPCSSIPIATRAISSSTASATSSFGMPRVAPRGPESAGGGIGQLLPIHEHDRDEQRERRDRECGGEVGPPAGPARQRDQSDVRSHHAIDLRTD